LTSGRKHWASRQEGFPATAVLGTRDLRGSSNLTYPPAPTWRFATQSYCTGWV